MSSKITFAFVNCNRLHYLISSVESFYHCTSDYPNREFIIIDNASVEVGTTEYLNEKEAQGFTVVRRETRNPSTEYAEALNTIAETYTGDFIAVIPGDMQCVVNGGWLSELVQTLEKNADKVGCVVLDMQREITNSSHRYSPSIGTEDYPVFLDQDRYRVVPCGGAMYPKRFFDKLYPWKKIDAANLSNLELQKLAEINQILVDEKLDVYGAIPFVPPAISIATDPKGVSAKVRMNKRFGQYIPPQVGWKYYHVYEFAELASLESYRVYSLEDLAEAEGDWKLPKDANGVWIKGNLSLETSANFEGEELPVKDVPVPNLISFTEEKSNDYVDEWLND